MRARTRCFRMRAFEIALLGCLALAPASPAFAQFGLTSVSINRNIPSQRTFIVRTNSKAPVPANLSDKAKWRISITRAGMARVLTSTEIDSITPKASGSSIDVTLTAPGFADVSNVLVVFEDQNLLLTASYKAPDAPDAVAKAKGKDDADIYAAGGFIAATKSAPIVMIDAKLQLGWPYGRDAHWAGVSAAFALNPDAKPPAESTDVNPDAINIFYQMDWARAFPVNRFFDGIQLVGRPIGGEFSSDPKAGNLMAAGQVNFFSAPYFNSIVVDPFVGVQFGQNKQKPTELFDRPVDLSGYDKIARLAYGFDTAYYNFGAKVGADNPYRLVASFAWRGWALGTNEPFVQSQRIVDEEGKSKRAKVLEMRGGTRNYIEAAITYNATDHFGVAIVGKRGSQPPLFQYVDSQIGITLTYKAKLQQDLKTKR
jgi:hypothetical protein